MASADFRISDFQARESIIKTNDGIQGKTRTPVTRALTGHGYGCPRNSRHSVPPNLLVARFRQATQQ